MMAGAARAVAESWGCATAWLSGWLTHAFREQLTRGDQAHERNADGDNQDLPHLDVYSNAMCVRSRFSKGYE